MTDNISMAITGIDFCFYCKVLNIIVLFFFVRSLVFSDIVVDRELIVKNVLILNFC